MRTKGPPRVLVDCRVVSPRLDGLGRYTLELVRALLGVASEFEFVVLVPEQRPRDHPLARLLRDTSVATIGCDAGIFSLGAQTAVPRAVARGTASVYHYPHFNLPFATPGRVVTTIHDLTPLIDPQYFPTRGTLKRTYFRASTAFTLRRSMAVITPTLSVAVDIGRVFGRRQHVVPIPEGVAQNFVMPSPDERERFKAQYGLGRPYLLYVGVRRPHKNLERIVRAFAGIVGRVDHDLVLVGHPSTGQPDLLALADDLGAAGRVRSLGYVPDEELPSAYTGADAFVLCSLQEGFGLGVLEAMRCGTPVVTSRSGATGEVAGDAALLVDPLSIADIARALMKVCSDPTTRSELRQRGLARVRDFTWRRTAERTLDVYRQAL